MTPPLGMAPFANQSRAEHAGVLLGGAAACLLGYAGGVSLLFGIDALGHGEPAGPRRVAAVFGSLACWGFYAGAFVRGKGGPVTDVVVYPVATVAVVPVAFRWALFGPAWDAVRDRVGLLAFRPEPLVDAAVLVLPGVAFAAGLLALWASLLGESAIEDWKREHLSAAFREAFVEE